MTANGPTNDVTLFTFDSGGSANYVTSIGLAGAGPSQVLFHPNGTVVYATNTTSNPATITAFTVSATALTPLPGAPFAMSANVKGPSGMAIK